MTEQPTPTEIIPLRQRRKVATRNLVVAAAKSLFEAEGGYVAATIRDIAAKAGRSTGAIFANFKDKEAMYRDIYGHAPITPEMGRELLLTLRGLAKTEPASESGRQLRDDLRGAVVAIWPKAFDPETEVDPA